MRSYADVLVSLRETHRVRQRENAQRSVAELLQHASFLKECPAVLTDALADAVTQRVLDPGATLFEQGAEGSSMYFIGRGTLEVIVDGTVVPELQRAALSAKARCCGRSPAARRCARATVLSCTS
jgi:hypothetical protein